MSKTNKYLNSPSVRGSMWFSPNFPSVSHRCFCSASISHVTYNWFPNQSMPTHKWFCAAFLSHICFYRKKESNCIHPMSYYRKHFTLGSLFRPYDKNGPSWEQQKKKITLGMTLQSSLGFRINVLYSSTFKIWYLWRTPVNMSLS